MISPTRIPSCRISPASSLLLFATDRCNLRHWLRLRFRYRLRGTGGLVRGRRRDRFVRWRHRLFQRNDGVPPDRLSNLTHGALRRQNYDRRFHASHPSSSTGKRRYAVLEEMAGSLTTLRPADLERVFEQHRQEIEQVTAAKILQGHFQDDDVVPHPNKRPYALAKPALPNPRPRNRAAQGSKDDAMGAVGSSSRRTSAHHRIQAGHSILAVVLSHQRKCSGGVHRQLGMTGR